jgi:hypothetical protein
MPDGEDGVMAGMADGSVLSTTGPWRRQSATVCLFTRRTCLKAGSGGAGVEWAGSICAKVKEFTGHEIELWESVLSPGVGTISWTGWFEDLASLEAVADKLEAEPLFGALCDTGAKFTQGGVDDGLIQPIYGEPPTAAIQYAASAVAVAAAGNVERAMAAGIEIAQKAEAITGLSTLFARSLTGPYGAVGWLTGYENITQMENAESALAGDPSWWKLIDSTKGCFVENPSLSRSTIFRKLG